MYTTDDEVCRHRNMFCKIKYIVFKIKIAASSNRLLSTTDIIRSLEKCYKKQEKVVLDIMFFEEL